MASNPKKIRSVYEKRSVAPGVVCPEPSRTQKQFLEESDINNIMKRFKNTGVLPGMIRSNPQYGDFSDPVDYQEACNIVIRSREQFEALGSRVRERFGNDPEKFLKFVADPSNAEEMVRLGLAVKRPTQGNVSEKAGAAEATAEKSKTPKPKAEE